MNASRTPPGWMPLPGTSETLQKTRQRSITSLAMTPMLKLGEAWPLPTAPGKQDYFGSSHAQISLLAGKVPWDSIQALTYHQGYIFITSPGEYTFQVGAADCHRLSVDEVYIVERPGCHPYASWRRSSEMQLSEELNNGSIALISGYHRVILEYFERQTAKKM